MKTGSVCSGYGGLDTAAHAVLGGELAWVADPDPGASAALAHHFPLVPNLGDITAVDWSSAEPVDVLTAGYPCQPFSAAGRRKGAEDARHLWPHVAAAIGALRPGTVVLENVHGHLTLGFDIVLADLAALGYDAEWTVVTASAAGACHRRARLFILAFPARARAVAGVPVAVIRDGAWLEPCESLFGAVQFAGRIPASGRMTAGRVYVAEGALTATAAGPLKTPTAQLAINGGSQHPGKRRAGGHGPTLADQVEHELLPTPMTGYSQRTPGEWRSARPAGNGAERERVGDPAIVAEHLLPTPDATDGKGGGAPIGRVKGGRPGTIADADLPAAVALLPTPRATDGTKGGPNQRGSSGDLMLPSAVMELLPTPNAARVGSRTDTRLSGDGRETPNKLGWAIGALLPTPSVADGTGGHKTRSGDRKDEPLLGGIAMLLPTPRVTSRAGMKPSPATLRGTHGTDLGPAIGALLPTPSAGNFNDGEDLASWEARRQRNLAKGVGGNGQGTPLPIAAQQVAGTVDWGPYEAAIRRWEAVTGCPAPRPTVPGKTGERLNAALPEWMMGLPSGWITEVPGLSRNAQLRLAGNGVVPAQAELALRILLDRVNFEREAA